MSGSARVRQERINDHLRTINDLKSNLKHAREMLQIKDERIEIRGRHIAELQSQVKTLEKTIRDGRDYTKTLENAAADLAGRIVDLKTAARMRAAGEKK